jgi:ADP-dependent phosphofructokinase/glucokinase
MTSNLFDDKELELYIDATFYRLIDKFDVSIEPKIFSKYFLIVMNYLDDRASKRGVKKNDESILQYKKNLLELTTECVFETFPNYLLGAGKSVLFPIYEEYKIKLIHKSSKK